MELPKQDSELRNKTIHLICQRKAKKDNVILPETYWKHPDWKSFFMQQTKAYSQLYKIYPQVAIHEALVKTPNCWSIASKWFDKEIQKVCKKVNKQVSSETVTPDTNIEHKQTETVRSKWTDLD